MGVGYLVDFGYRDSIDSIILAMCRDYEERKRAISDKIFCRRTLMEYEYLNTCLSDAAKEIAGDDYEIYIKEIGSGIGYARSLIEGVSEFEYKRTKKEVKINIAKKLHLID